MNSMGCKVVAVSVTFNDSEYIFKQLKYLLNQSIELYKIVIVDNNSSDKNKMNLKTIDNKKVDIVWLPFNCGGAGGFETGMRYAHDKYNPDWYWLMDADAFPKENCLEKLLEYENDGENIGVLTPIIFGCDLHEYQLYHHKYISKFLYKDLMKFHSFDMVPKTSYIEANAFVGPLISKYAVEKVGYPDGSLFIYGDDSEFTYRISRKFKIKLIKDAVINHRDQPIYGKQKPENWWKDYYLFRNRILFIRKYKTNIIQEFIGLSLLYVIILKQIIKIVAFEPNINFKKKILRIKTLMQSVLDGAKGISGKTVDPIKYKEFVLGDNK